MNYKDKHTLEERKAESERLLKRHPNNIPIIVEKVSKSDPDIDKTKYLVNRSISMAQFRFILQKRMNIDPNTALFIYSENNELFQPSDFVERSYNLNKNEDGFMYVKYGLEATYGNELL
jgi:GABA(A) receptor-associated protein